MKAIVVLLLIIGVAAYFGFRTMNQGMSTQRFDMFTAFAEPGETGVEMNITLTAGMTERESPEGNTQFNAAWQEWVDQHFRLLDTDGEAVAVEYINESKLIGAKPGSPDVGYLRAILTPGANYTLEYTPVRDQPTVGRAAFTAPDRRKEPFMLKVSAESE